MKTFTVLVGIFAALSLHATHALDNGLYLTPPIGYATWNTFGCNYTASMLQDQADLMVKNGMRDAGYRTIIIQECIVKHRDANGTLVPDAARFPNGIKPVCDYFHERGFLCGIYTDVGPETCAGWVGSFEHDEIDAKTFASWGIDFVEEDSCHHPKDDKGSLIPYRELYGRMRDALRATDRPIALYACVQGQEDVSAQWGTETANLWRTTGDICAPGHAQWSRVLSNFRGNAKLPAVSGPSHWQDPDMLVVGMPGVTSTEWATQFSLWAISAAPLWASVGVGPDLPAAALEIFLNTEVIAVDQDRLGHAGTCLGGTCMNNTNGGEVWGRPLYSSFPQLKRVAVVLFNSGETTINVAASLPSVDLTANVTTRVRDLWQHKDLAPTTTGIEATLAAHASAMFVLEQYVEE